LTSHDTKSPGRQIHTHVDSFSYITIIAAVWTTLEKSLQTPTSKVYTTIMASADELKALGNKAIAEKNFDDAM
jgi:hypothetical protein